MSDARDRRSTNEELREALLTTERLRARAERQQLENQLLLEGLNDVLASAEPTAVLRVAFSRFYQVIDFEQGFILREDGPERLVCAAASHDRFVGSVWPVGSLFARVRDGAPSAIFDVARVEEWKAQPDRVRSGVESALHAPFAFEGGVGLVVLVSSRKRAFKRSDGDLLKRFSVLAAQVLTHLEARDLREENHALAEARRQAEAASRAKSSFLAMMSHELRTPMTGVLGMLDLIERDGLSGGQAEYARVLRSSASRLLRLLDDVLDFSKIEAGALTFEAIDFDLHQVLEAAVELYRGAAAEKGLDLRICRSEVGATSVRGDPVRLGQVVQNLVSNAVKFTEAGSVELDVETWELGRERYGVHFEVRDTGPGIAPESRARLFEPFAQADGSITRRFGGTGLGLSIVRRLVEAMGGTVSVDSEVGRGTRFSVRLELPKGEAPPAPSRSARLAGQDDGGGQRGLRVLVVDDDAVNRLVIEEALSGMGHEVSLAEGGEEALRVLAESTVDVVLMDCHMPGLDGPSTVRRMRSLENAASRVPVIALTADVMDGARRAFAEVDVQGFLTKPIDWEAMARALDEIGLTGPR